MAVIIPVIHHTCLLSVGVESILITPCALLLAAQACAASPSASAWLGVAASRCAMEDLDAAGQVG